MKNIFGLLLVVMLGVVACEGPMGPPGLPGENAIPTEWAICDFEIIKYDWELIGRPNEIGSFYYYVFDVPEITPLIFDDGAVICYYQYRDDFGKNVQTPLPFTYYNISIDDYGNESPFAVQISYDVLPGSIAFKLVFSDFYTGVFEPPSICKFKLTLIY